MTRPQAAWSWDGRYAIFNGDATGGAQIYLIDVASFLQAGNL